MVQFHQSLATKRQLAAVWAPGKVAGKDATEKTFRAVLFYSYEPRLRVSHKDRDYSSTQLEVFAKKKCQRQGKSEKNSRRSGATSDGETTKIGRTSCVVFRFPFLLTFCTPLFPCWEAKPCSPLGLMSSTNHRNLVFAQQERKRF